MMELTRTSTDIFINQAPQVVRPKGRCGSDGSRVAYSGISVAMDIDGSEASKTHHEQTNHNLR